MRWNCPHCGTQVTAPADQLGEDWTFARCFQCQGTALVHPAGWDPIKIDPSTSENPQASSQDGPQSRDEAFEPVASKPVIRPAARAPKVATDIMAQPLQQTSPRARAATPPPPPPAALFKKTLPITLNPVSPEFPKPLPEPPLRNARSRFLRGAMALSGLTAMASGAYLYIQGQELWIKAKQAGLSRLEDSETAPAETEVAANSPAPPKTDAQRTTSAGNDHPLQVHANHKTAPETERAGSDRPIFETSGNDLTVKLGVKIPADPHERLLRSGPGSEFAPLGAPEKGVAYTVTGWTDHWYRVLLPETSAQPAGPSGGATRSEASPPGTIEIRTSQGKTTEIQSSATGIAGASGNLGARALAEANSAAVAPTQLPSVGEIQQSARDTALKRRQRTAWIRSDLVQVLPVGLPASGQTR